MGSRLATVWRRRAARVIAGLALWMAAAASILAPPSVDTAMVERAVSGAEWLAERARSDPERMEAAAIEPDLMSWLLVAGGATGSEYEAFATYLANAGYGDAQFAVPLWTEEFSRILAAATANALAVNLRTVGEIEAELQRLPTIPLDDQGKEVRRELLDELVSATTPLEERRAAASASGRLSSLRALAGLEDAQ